VAPLVVVLSGLLVGWQHLGFDTVFTESLTLMVLVAVLGTASASLGLAFTFGFALGDFFLAHTVWTTPSSSFFFHGHSWFDHGTILPVLVRVRVPLLIEYALLLLLAARISVLAKALVAPLAPPASWDRRLRLGIAIAAYVIVTYALVYFWTQMVPLLVRPLFTWSASGARNPTKLAVAPLQQHGGTVVAWAVAVALARMAIQAATVVRSDLAARLDAAQAPLRAAGPVRRARRRLHPWIAAVAATAGTILLLAGIMETWEEAVALGAVILAVRAARAGLVPVPLGPWPRLARQVPAVVRLGVGLIVIHEVAASVLPGRLNAQAQSFQPLVVLVGVAVIVFYLLVPTPSGTRRHEQAPA
jgi:hypothetical protein